MTTSSPQPALIKAIAPWFGSKRTLAPRIVAELGRHSAYWSPFCGSLAVLLQKQPSSHETVNDLHGDLINLARVIQDPDLGHQLHQRTIRILAAEPLITDYDQQVRSDEYDNDEPNVDRAVAYFVSSWMGRNGYCGLKKTERGRTIALRWTPNGGHGGQRFASAADSIPAWHQRLRRVVILRRDAFDLLPKIDDHTKVAIYCDPPYLAKSDEYQHDFDNHEGGLLEDDHDQLAKALARFKRARVVVSYYDHPRLNDLYPRWTRRTFDIAKNTGHTAHRGKAGKRATEVLLINGPSYTGDADG